jgi:CBS domain containing-hemolysin-like protein
MTILVITIVAVVLISALCSLTEACLYSVSWTYIEKLRSSGSRTGQILFDLRSDIKRPIAAVLILNTIANTAGASVAGAIAGHILGDAAMGFFAALMTLLILTFGEILPKTVGVTYSEGIARLIARPLRILTFLFTPLIWLSNLMTRLVGKTETEPAATAEDILALTQLSRRSGQINASEATAIGNILSFDDKRVMDIMTPRTMVFSLPASMTVAEAYALPQIWNYSRIPVYGDDNEDIVGIILRRRIVKGFAEDQDNRTLDELMQPVHFILENQQLDVLLKEFLNSHTHLFAVLDEYGGLAGVVSLEDVLEEMLGQEIVDESDAYTDMREAARKRRKQTSVKQTPAKPLAK